MGPAVSMISVSAALAKWSPWGAVAADAPALFTRAGQTTGCWRFGPLTTSPIQVWVTSSLWITTIRGRRVAGSSETVTLTVALVEDTGPWFPRWLPLNLGVGAARGAGARPADCHP